MPQELAPVSSGTENAEFKELLRQAESGNSNAQAVVGSIYCDGKLIEQDYKEAFKWFQKAAEQELTMAQKIVGAMYTSGKGVSQDYRKGLYWYKKAAEDGDAESQKITGIAYSEGKWVSQDYIQAHMWLNLAASSEEEAAALRDELAKKMTPSQIEKAQELARNFVLKSE
ncbi:hypothetical protein MASR1M12_12670 [Erysipelotrichia bacterium]